MSAFTYVYILKSVKCPDRFYVGHTRDLRNRLEEHNGWRVLHTAKWKPRKMKHTSLWPIRIVQLHSIGISNPLRDAPSRRSDYRFASGDDRSSYSERARKNPEKHLAPGPLQIQNPLRTARNTGL